MPATTAGFPSLEPGTRFAITVSQTPYAAVRVVDRLRERQLFDWSGSVATHLMESTALPTPSNTVATRFHDKGFVQHLALLAASASMTIASQGIAGHGISACVTPSDTPGERRWSRLAARLRRLNASLRGDEITIAKLLFSRPGLHYSCEEVACLLQLLDRPLPQDRVGASLDRLTRLGVILRIDVDVDRVFYDIDTRPHLHIFDEARGELRDAEVDGVIRKSSKGATARVRISGGNRVHIS